MKLKGPIITLAAGLMLAGVLLVLDLNATSKRNAANAPAAAVTTARPPATTTPVPPPTTTPPAPGPQVTYAGDAGAGSIAIAVKDGQAVAYVCDGKTAEAWLQGTVTDGTITMTGARNASLTGTIAAGVARGTVSAVGKQWPFTAKIVAPPSGLYRAAAEVRGAQVVGGWIVLENGKQVGMVNYGDHEDTAPPLTGTTATIADTPVTAVKLDGSGL
jgi:hypothetical protein